MSRTTALRALDHIRTSFQIIGHLENVPNQLKRYASNCYTYALKPIFRGTFVSLYNDKQDYILVQKSYDLRFKQ